MKDNKIVKYLRNHKKTMKHVSNISFGIGAALGVYALITMFVTYSNLPPGVCPIDTGRPILIAAMAVLGISLLASLFTEKKDKKKKSRHN